MDMAEQLSVLGPVKGNHPGQFHESTAAAGDIHGPSVPHPEFAAAIQMPEFII